MVGLDKLDFANADKNLVPAFLAGKDAQFFQDLNSNNTQSEQNTPSKVGSTDPFGGKPDLKV